MSLLPSINTDYTDIDFDSLRVRLYALIQSVFPEWTDQNVANFGNLLIELFAFVGDVLTFYLDNHGRESRIATATQRRSLLGLAKLIGYTVPGATAATADVTVSIPSNANNDILFPAGTVVSTAEVVDPVEFQLEADATILTGTQSITAGVKNSLPAQDTFTSNGLANQEYTLTSTPYLDDSAVVVAANGTFTQVDNFLESTTTDKHFVVVVDQNDRARVRFGNGTNGVIPTGTITIDYETGGGASGNVEASTITRIQGTYYDGAAIVIVSVNNPSAASGGSDRQSNAQIKEIAPSTVRAPINSITREDFAINALRLSSVARVLVLTSNEDTAVPENTGIIYPIPVGGGLPSAALKAEVLNQLTVEYPPPLTFTVLVYDPSYLTVTVSAVVYLAKGYAESTVRSSIVANLQAFFDPQTSDGTPNPLVDFGANLLNAAGEVDPVLAWSDVHNVIRDTTGVRKMDPGSGLLLNGVRQGVILEPREFPQLGTVLFTNADTGNPF
jgi:hypothetical protein